VLRAGALALPGGRASKPLSRSFHSSALREAPGRRPPAPPAHPPPWVVVERPVGELVCCRGNWGSRPRALFTSPERRRRAARV